MNRVIFIGWVQAILFLIISFSPYKIPRSIAGDFNETRLLVKHTATTGPSTEIVKGENALRSSLGIQNSEGYGIEFEKGFPGIGMWYPTFYATQYIIEGEVIGVTDSSYIWPNIPIFRVHKWWPVSYIPIFKTATKWYQFLIIAELILIPAIIILSAIHLIQKLLIS